MTFEDALTKLKTNPKNSGVSEVILKGVAARIAKTLPEDATDEITETRFAEEQEFITEMQAENDRRVTGMKKELDDLKKKTPKTEKKDEEPGDPNAIEANGRPKWWNDWQKEEAAKRQAESEIIARKEARDTEIRNVAKELEISEKQLSRILIKDDEDPRTVLTEWKQERINDSIPSGDSLFPVNLSKQATDENEAKRLVQEYAAK